MSIDFHLDLIGMRTSATGSGNMRLRMQRKGGVYLDQSTYPHILQGVYVYCAGDCKESSPEAGLLDLFQSLCIDEVLYTLAKEKLIFR